RADEATDAARRFADAGVRNFEAGRFREAAADYERAYQARPLAAFVYNVATAYDKAGANAAAVDAYQRYLRLPGHHAADDAAVRARVAVLDRDKPAVVAPAPQRPAFPYIEPVTRHTFATYTILGERGFSLLGAGSMSKTYAVALYVEDDVARAAF